VAHPGKGHLPLDTPQTNPETIGPKRAQTCSFSEIHDSYPIYLTKMPADHQLSTLSAPSRSVPQAISMDPDVSISLTLLAGKFAFGLGWITR
jgi:hypothetical protein